MKIVAPDIPVDPAEALPMLGKLTAEVNPTMDRQPRLNKAGWTLLRRIVHYTKAYCNKRYELLQLGD